MKIPASSSFNLTSNQFQPSMFEWYYREKQPIYSTIIVIFIMIPVYD